MAPTVEVLHFTDAGCPWDYSAEPVRVALEVRYGEQLAWRNVQVGLHESGRAMAQRGYATEELAQSYRLFGERYGMPFCMHERPRLMGTWPGCRAVKAAEAQDPSLGAALLRRLRLAWFVEQRLVDEREELLRLAGDVERLDRKRFARELDGDGADAAFRADMELARRPDAVARRLEKTAQPRGEPSDRFTTPTYRFSADGESVTVPGMQPLEAYEVALHNLVPSIERRDPPDPLELLESRPAEPLATAEVAAATGRPRARVEQQLAALRASGVIEELAAGDARLWCPGTPPFELDCPPKPSLIRGLEEQLAS